MKTILFSILVTTAAACGGGNKQPANPEPTETTPAPTETAAETPTADPETPSEAPAPDPDQAKNDAKAAELAAFEKAKPVFDGFCKSCHVKGEKNANAKKLSEFEMTAYPFTGKHNTAKDIRDVLGISGGKPTMPKTKPGAVKGDDLAAIAAWADAWDAAEAAGAHEQ